jgi:tetratricopeptide (TPR) repeat protein
MYDGNVQKAEETLLLARERYAQLDEDDEISLLLAHIAVAREGKSMALEMLQKVRSTVKTEEKRFAVTLDMAQLYSQLGQYAKAIELLGEIPQRKKLPEMMYRRDYLLLEAYVSVDSLAKALQLAEAMLKVREYDKNQAKILLQKGAAQYRLKEYPKAVATYELLLERQKTGPEAAQAAFELATIYQYQLVDVDKAKEFYAKAGELASQDDEYGVLSRKRLAALNRLAEISAQVWPTDSAPPPDTSLSQLQRDSVRTVNRYAIGELYWLELQQPDSAYAHFLRISADSTLSGEHCAKALYAACWIALFSQKDTAAADSLLAQLTLRFPSDTFTKQAQLERGLSSTVTTLQDSAALLFSSAELLYVQDNNPVAAANAYLKVYKAYPALELASKSLYASAWLCDNVLFKKETAKMLYEKLCAEYPASEYCLQGARPRIKVAMDTLQALKAAQ